MPNVDTVLTRYQVDAVQAVEETKRLTEVERNLDGSGKNLARNFADLEGGLRSWRREQTQQQRTAGFLAREFGEIATAAGVGSEAVRGFTALFVEGVAGGVGFGLALQAVQQLAGHWNRVAEEAKKAREEGEKSATSLADALARNAAQLAKLRGDEVGSARIETEREIEKLRAKELDTTKKLAEAQADLVATHFWEIGTGKEDQQRRRDLVERLKNDVETVQRDIVAAWQGLAGKLEPVEEAQGRKSVESTKKWEDEKARIRKEAFEKRIEAGLRESAVWEAFVSDQDARDEEHEKEEVENLARIDADIEVFNRRALESELRVLNSLRVATVRHTGDSLKAFRDLAKVKKDDADAEAKGTQLTMAGLDALGSAIQDFTKSNVEALAKQSAVEGIVNTAKGLAALGLAFLGVPGAGPAAGAYFQAAAMDFAVAGVAAGVAATMGSGGGGGGVAPLETTPGPPGAQPSGQAVGTGNQQPRQTIIFMGAYQTEAEAARILARHMETVDRLRLQREVN